MQSLQQHDPVSAGICEATIACTVHISNFTTVWQYVTVSTFFCSQLQTRLLMSRVSIHQHVHNTGQNISCQVHILKLPTEVLLVLTAHRGAHSLLSSHITASCPNFTGIDFGSKSEGAQRLIGSFWHRCYIDKHEGLGITTQAGLQQVGELGVAVGDVSLFVGQCHDHIT